MRADGVGRLRGLMSSRGDRRARAVAWDTTRVAIIDAGGGARRTGRLARHGRSAERGGIRSGGGGRGRQRDGRSAAARRARVAARRARVAARQRRRAVARAGADGRRPDQLRHAGLRRAPVFVLRRAGRLCDRARRMRGARDAARPDRRCGGERLAPGQRDLLRAHGQPRGPLARGLRADHRRRLALDGRRTRSGAAAPTGWRSAACSRTGTARSRTTPSAPRPASRCRSTARPGSTTSARTRSTSPASSTDPGEYPARRSKETSAGRARSAGPGSSLRGDRGARPCSRCSCPGRDRSGTRSRRPGGGRTGCHGWRRYRTGTCRSRTRCSLRRCGNRRRRTSR